MAPTTSNHNTGGIYVKLEQKQVYIHGSAGFDPDTLRALTGGKHLQVTGFSAQYETTYEVAPRQPSDIVVQ